MTVKFSKNNIDGIVKMIQEDGLVAIMSDTVYGLAADSSKDYLYEKLKKAKGRPEDKPFPLMVASYSQIEEIAILSDRDRHLMHQFMPGACTFIFRLKDSVFSFLGEQKTIGIRMADDPWVMEIIDKVGAPLWLPSANLSGFETALNSDMVLEQLDGIIQGVVIGESYGKQSSSVFDLTKDEIVCLREGPISLNDIIKEEKKMKKISIACDHGAYEHKEAVKSFLITEGYDVIDFGSHSEESVDYPDVIYPAAKAVRDHEVDLGIVLCGSGIGASITANKVKGIRCALVTSTEVAQLTREHNDSNVLALAGRTTDLDTNLAITKIWLETAFSNDERHERRIEKLAEIEEKELCQ